MANNDGGPAFPATEDHGLNYGMFGMTLRDYFAAKAMQSYLTHLQGAEMLEIQLAEYAYSIADAMLKARGVKSCILA